MMAFTSMPKSRFSTASSEPNRALQGFLSEKCWLFGQRKNRLGGHFAAWIALHGGTDALQSGSQGVIHKQTSERFGQRLEGVGVARQIGANGHFFGAAGVVVTLPAVRNHHRRQTKIQ